MEKFIRLALLLLLSTTIGFTTACSDKTANEDISSTIPDDGDGDDDGVIDPGQPGGPVTPPPVTSAAPLALKMSTKFDGTPYSNTLTFVETGTDTCSASTATPEVTCTVQIPEGRLYYSSLTLAYSYLPSSCRLMTFQPYYYQASIGFYLPPRLVGIGPPVDCTGTDVPVGPDCFGGAAPQIVGSFPEKRALIYLPDESDLNTSVSASKTVSSAYSNAYVSNRHTVNDLALANYGSAFNSVALGGQGDAILAGTYTDYKWSCRDNWADPEAYVINLKVKDVDTYGTGANHFRTWKELP